MLLEITETCELPQEESVNREGKKSMTSSSELLGVVIVQEEEPRKE